MPQGLVPFLHMAKILRKMTRDKDSALMTPRPPSLPQLKPQGPSLTPVPVQQLTTAVVADFGQSQSLPTHAMLQNSEESSLIKGVTSQGF